MPNPAPISPLPTGRLSWRKRTSSPPSSSTRRRTSLPMLRRLELADMDEAARVHRLAFDRALPPLAGLHTPDQDRWFFRERVFATSELWGAFDGAGMTGMIAFRKEWIDQLYVLPDAQGRGTGSSLLQIAKDKFDMLQLWTFQRNVTA